MDPILTSVPSDENIMNALNDEGFDVYSGTVSICDVIILSGHMDNTRRQASTLVEKIEEAYIAGANSNLDHGDLKVDVVDISPMYHK